MRAELPRARRRLLVLVLSVLAGIAVGSFAEYQGSRGGLHARAGRRAAAEVTAAGADDVSTYWNVRLRSTSGLAPTALIRVPREGMPGTHWRGC